MLRKLNDAIKNYIFLIVLIVVAVMVVGSFIGMNY